MVIDIIIYILIFILGITFGSFYTLATYRIPLKQDITHKRSYCPNCGHKLGFLDLIPVFSYLFLKGKCRYCKEKIRIRYLLLEVLSGITFVLFYCSLSKGLLGFNVSYIAYFLTGIVYITCMFIIAGIDKEKKEIQNNVTLFLVIVEALYIIYLYIFEKVNIYKYVMYLFVVMLLFLLNNIYYSKKLKNSYTIQILILILAMAMYTGNIYTILTIIMTLLIISFKGILEKTQEKKYVKKTKKKIKLPMGFYICCSNLIVLIISNLIVFNFN